MEEPTDWCAPMVVVPKRTGKLRICTDLTELNKSVMREKHPSVESTLGQLAGARVFSKLDANAVLLQMQAEKEWKPVVYASRALSDTEQRYAQIEKEALASTWACERFVEFLIGKDFHIETDHKPLVPLLSSKRLDELPPRIQRLRMRLMRFSYTIFHVAGKNIATADVLSRAPTSSAMVGLSEEDINLYVDSVMACLPATEKRLMEIQKHQETDPILQQLRKYCAEGWPDQFSIDQAFLPYWSFSENFLCKTDYC